MFLGKGQLPVSFLLKERMHPDFPLKEPLWPYTGLEAHPVASGSSYMKLRQCFKKFLGNVIKSNNLSWYKNSCNT